jgi:DNA-binding NarL/FixJ family response regulator
MHHRGHPRLPNRHTPSHREHFNKISPFSIKSRPLSQSVLTPSLVELGMAELGPDEVSRVGGLLMLRKAGSRSQGNKAPSGSAVQAGRPRSRRRVVLVEPRELIRDSIANCLTAGNPGLLVLAYSSVHEVDLGESADSIALVLSFLRAKPEEPDVAAEVTRTQARLPNVPVVVVADGDEVSTVRKLIDLGVRGYVPSSFDFAMFREAIQFVAAGGTFVPSSTLLQTRSPQMTDLDEKHSRAKRGRRDAAIQISNENQEQMRAISFTPRELDVISRLKEGKSNKLIARDLAICEGTIKLYVRRIMKKLRVENRTQAALAATNMMLPE